MHLLKFTNDLVLTVSVVLPRFYILLIAFTNHIKVNQLKLERYEIHDRFLKYKNSFYLFYKEDPFNPAVEIKTHGAAINEI